MRDLLRLLASYNTWMNAKLYKAAGELTADELAEDRGAFFGSVFRTLNHIAVADRIWLRRFAEHPSQPEVLAPVRALPLPKSLDEILFPDLDQLSAHRAMLDAVIERWVGGLTDADLNQTLRYTNSKGAQAKRLSGLVLHFFNHQTHHRGQATTLLSQFGKDVGVTDLLALLPNEE